MREVNTNLASVDSVASIVEEDSQEQSLSEGSLDQRSPKIRLVGETARKALELYKFRKTGAAVIGAALIATPNALAWKSREDINSIASWIAMRPVKALCYTPAEVKQESELERGLAYTPSYGDSSVPWRPKNYAELTPQACDPLIHYFDGESNYEFPLRTSKEITEVNNLGIATLALTHESYHLRKTPWGWNEAKVECQAIRHVPYVVERMKMPRELGKTVYANALRYHKWVVTIPWYNQKNCLIQPRSKIEARFDQTLAP